MSEARDTSPPPVPLPLRAGRGGTVTEYVRIAPVHLGLTACAHGNVTARPGSTPGQSTLPQRTRRGPYSGRLSPAGGTMHPLPFWPVRPQFRIDAMSGSSSRSPFARQLQHNLKTNLEYLDRGCRRYGVTVPMFRTAKYLFHVAVLLFTVYLIEYAAVDPMVASGIAIVLIAGPEGMESWLVRQGILAEAEQLDDRNGASD
jgi:hypothetical protein